MEYYILKNSTGKDIGTKYPQCEEMSNDYKYDSPNSVYNTISNMPLSFIPNLDSFKLLPKSKITDIISAATISDGLIISHNLKNVLETFNLKQTRFYPASILHKEKKYTNYYWLHIYTNLSDVIDFENSIFFTTNTIGIKKNKLQINSIIELDKARKELAPLLKIKPEKIQLKSEIEIDLFKLTDITSDIFISKRLKDCIENKFTGIEIKENSYLF